MDKKCQSPLHEKTSENHKSKNNSLKGPTLLITLERKGSL